MKAKQLVLEIQNECDTESQMAELIKNSNLTEREKWDASDLLGLEYPYNIENSIRPE